MAGGLVRALATLVVVVALALPFADGISNPLLAGAALTLTALVVAALGVITGIWAESFDQHSFVASLVIAPLALVGGVFYSVRSLPEPWQTLTRIDPLFYLVDATRAGFTGVHEASVLASLLVAAGLAVGAFVVSVLLIARGWRLKP
jgi:ABC-2 type transport system permease protein